MGLNTAALTWTSSPRLAMLSVVAVDVWQWTPFMFLLLLAGLQAIPQEPYEAALIDGSSAWQTFRHVTLPLLKPAILVALLLRTMDLLRVFDQVLILTEGGPGFATETIGWLPASVYVTELMGSETFVFLTLGGKQIIARAPADFRAEVASAAWIEIETPKAHFFHPTSGERLTSERHGDGETRGQGDV